MFQSGKVEIVIIDSQMNYRGKLDTYLTAFPLYEPFHFFRPGPRNFYKN